MKSTPSSGNAAEHGEGAIGIIGLVPDAGAGDAHRAEPEAGDR